MGYRPRGYQESNMTEPLRTICLLGVSIVKFLICLLYKILSRYSFFTGTQRTAELCISVGPTIWHKYSLSPYYTGHIILWATHCQDEESETKERLSNLPRVTQQGCRKFRIQTQKAWLWSPYFISFFLKRLIYLAVLGLSCDMRTLNPDIWNLVPWPGIEPAPPALGVQSLSHWTTREVP